MSVTERQDTISRLILPQKRAVARYINYLMAEDAPATVARRRRLTRGMKEMNSGKTLTFDEVRRLRAAKVGALLRKTDTSPRMTLSQIKAQRARPART